MDSIIIKDLQIYGYHGVMPEENVLGQMFYISLRLETDLQAAGVSDSLELSVSYADVCALVEKIFAERRFKLIEACAEYICAEILFKYKIVQAVEIELKKPSAPIGSHLAYAAVAMKRRRHRAYIGLGSNMGDSASILSQAADKLSNESHTRVLNLSSIIKTKPWGNENQPDFLNSACLLETTLEPQALLLFLQGIENAMGRERKEKWGPRTLDLDILFYDNDIIAAKALTVPHPYISERLFVLEPMNEIAPYFVHPSLNKTIKELLKELREHGQKA